MKKKMKIRALFIIALLIGGTYEIVQSINDFSQREFNELLNFTNGSFNSLIFTKPPTPASKAKTWMVDDENEIDEFLHFLQNYHVQKLKPEEIDVYDDIQQFGISLEDENGDRITVFINEDLIIQNNMLYYKIVDGPLDVDWLVHFFLNNQL
ncbi:hypothetical protein [Sporosarcina limicola]|uniref:Uncharacterized protein n=1 Tax=Sporosarcina limicola TaxID=34101 RepID=A0A927MJV1_9BACL|nr:hypothetical protein [Sporosarcina limicola]MBE1554292.1 hypothetical protein [Sporosarcina limicola]